MTKLDHHVLFTLLQRSWAILAGGITLLLIPSCLTATQQGYYYAFASLLAMQVFFDLGFNSVIVQLVGHEFSHLQRDSSGRLQGDPVHCSRLASLILLLRKWYRIAAILFFVCICATGYLFFNSRGELKAALWVGPWTLQLLFTSINLYFSPFLAVSEGQGHVGEVAKLRLQQAMAGYIMLWLLLLAGVGLWATPVIPAISAILNAQWLKGRHNGLTTIANGVDAEKKISWYREIFPFQWRIALSWISGYFIFSFFTPMVFRHQGAVEAGRVGMTLSIFSSLSTLGMSWISAKVPNFSMLIAQGKRQQLNDLFITNLKKSTISTAIICAALVLSIWALGQLHFSFITRLCDVPILLCLTIVTLCNTLIFSAAAYMRAHKEEPMLWNSVTMGALVLTAVWFCSQVSVRATMISYTALVLLLAVPWTAIIFYHNYYHRTA